MATRICLDDCLGQVTLDALEREGAGEHGVQSGEEAVCALQESMVLPPLLEMIFLYKKMDTSTAELMARSLF